MQRQVPCSLLVSLPILPQTAVIDCLSGPDKLSLFCTCRTLAKAVTATLPQVKLKVTSKTGWKGLSKVLASVTCKAISITNELTSGDQPDENNAVAMLLKSEPGCSYREVKKVELTISKKAPPLPCLLPSSLASMLPDMKELSIHYHSEQPMGTLQPIPYCSSLRKLLIDGHGSLQRVVGNHTAEDICKQLPNITSLVIEEYESAVVRYKAGNKPKGYVDRFLQAWSSQLTELVLNIYELPDKLQLCTQLQSLTCDGILQELLPRSLPTATAISCLTQLKLACFIDEAGLAAILYRTTLRMFTIKGFQTTLRLDWSNHPCTWQQLNLERLDFVDLGKLPLRSMRGHKGVYTKAMALPDPLLPGSLAAAEHVAKCISDAGVMVTAEKIACDIWINKPNKHSDDAACAAILHEVFRVVHHRPLYIDSFNYCAATHYPQSTTALVSWLSNGLRHITLHNWSLQPWFWQALQCCQNLQTIMFYTSTNFSTSTGKYVMQLRCIAEQLVGMSRRPTTVKLHCPPWERDIAKADALQKLKVQLQAKLPSSVVARDVSWSLLLSTYDVVVVPADMDGAVYADGSKEMNEVNAVIMRNIARSCHD